MKSKWLRVLGLVVALACVMSAVSGFVYASEDANEEVSEYGEMIESWDASETTEDHVTATLYKNEDDMTLVFSGNGRMLSSEALVLVDEEEVSSAAPWGAYNKDVTRIVFEDGVKNIGAASFQGFYNVIRLYIGADVEEIGDWAFDLCAHLVEVYNRSALDIETADGSLAWYKLVAFDNWDAESILTKEGDFVFTCLDGIGYVVNYTGEDEIVTVPDHFELNGETIPVTQLQQYALYESDSVKEFILPDTLQVVGFGSIENCHSLEKITIPDSVDTIMDSAFYGSSALKEITLSQNLTTLGKNVFWKTSIENLVIPESVTSIDFGALKSIANIWLDSETIAQTLTDEKAVERLMPDLATLYVSDELTVPAYIMETYPRGEDVEKDGRIYKTFDRTSADTTAAEAATEDAVSLPEQYTLKKVFDGTYGFGDATVTAGTNEDQSIFYLTWVSFDEQQILEGTVEDGIVNVTYDESGFMTGDAQQIWDDAVASEEEWTAVGSTEAAGADVPEDYTLTKVFSGTYGFGDATVTAGTNEDQSIFYLTWEAFDEQQILEGTVEDGIVNVTYDETGFMTGDAQLIWDDAVASSEEWTAR